jgi:hypothetical protein
METDMAGLLYAVRRYWVRNKPIVFQNNVDHCLVLSTGRRKML